MGQVDDVLCAVSHATEVSVPEIIGRRRFAVVVEARCLFCALCLAVGISFGSVSGTLGVSRQAAQSLYRTHEQRTLSYSYRILYRSAEQEYRRREEAMLAK